jgi:hypothetical protein
VVTDPHPQVQILLTTGSTKVRISAWGRAIDLLLTLPGHASYRPPMTVKGCAASLTRRSLIVILQSPFSPVLPRTTGDREKILGRQHLPARDPYPIAAPPNRTVMPTVRGFTDMPN